MRRLSRRVLSVVLAGSLATPAHAARPFATAPYLKTCEGFLTAIDADQIEAFFIDQARTPAERAQLLLDYGLVYTREYAKAVDSTLRRNPVMNYPRARAMKIRALRITPGGMRRFAGAVIKEFEREVAATAETDEGRRRLERTRKFFAALDRRPDRAEWLDAYGRAVRGSFMHSMRNHRAWADDKVQSHLPFWPAGTGLAGIPSAEYILQHHPPFHGIDNIDVMFFGWLGLMVGALGGLFAGLAELAFYHYLPNPAQPPPVLSHGKLVSYGAPDRNIDPAYRADPELTRITPDDLRAFTPIDLAYAGDAELRRFEDLLNTNAKFDARELDHDLARLSERGRRLAADWGDPRARLRFAAAVNDLIQIFTELRGSLRGRLSAGRELLQTLRSQLDRVGRVPLDATSAQLNEERVLKQELLMLRHRHAVERLDQIRIEDRATEDLARNIEPVLADLEQLLKPAPATTEEWQRLVGRSEAVAARIARSLAGVPRLAPVAEEPID